MKEKNNDLIFCKKMEDREQMSTKFCTQCGNPVTRQTPQDDDHVREVCSSCGHVHYENPKMVVGTIPVFQDRISYNFV